MNLETRSCRGCGTTFKVLKTSKQEYHSALCEHDSGGRKMVWGVVPKELRKDASVNESTTGKNIKKTQSSALKSSRSEKKVTTETKRRNMLEVENTIKSTKRPKTHEEPSGEGQTGTGLTSTSVPTIAKKGITSSAPSEKPDAADFRIEPSERLYSALEREQSTSMGLINSSVVQLKTLLDSVVEKYKDSDTRTLTALDVDDACKIAATIGGLMKVKVDASRVAVDMLKSSDRS